MPLSTSSSKATPIERLVPRGRWLLPWMTAVALLLLAITGLEAVLASKGFRPTVVDSAVLWGKERHRAAALGSRALILIGASRAQLDIDLTTLRRASELEPVQLAIDGSSFIPVLADLASDDNISGTIIVEYQDGALAGAVTSDPSLAYLSVWEKSRNHVGRLDFNASEAWLASLRQRWLRSYADGADPFAALVARALPPRATPQYLVTLPDRQRQADYRLVDMPAFYWLRAIRNAGIQQPASASSDADFVAQLEQRIKSLPEADPAVFADNARVVSAMVQQIEARGGKVIFIRFPTSGMVKLADDVRYPRGEFWERFLAEGSLRGLASADEQALNHYTCPDGSHLDRRDQVGFTQGLAAALQSRGWITSRR